MYEYFSLLNVLLFGVTFAFLVYFGRKAYKAYFKKPY